VADQPQSRAGQTWTDIRTQDAMTPANGVEQAAHFAGRHQPDQPQQIAETEAGDNGQGERAGAAQRGRERG